MPATFPLRRVGLKATLPRLHILDMFGEGGRHLNADDVYRGLMERDVDAGMATVYRVLAELEQAGLLRQVRFQAGKCFYELDDGQHHDHLVCTVCGRVQEFQDPGMDDAQRRVAQDGGFRLLDRALVLYGLCSDHAGEAAGLPCGDDEPAR